MQSVTESESPLVVHVAQRAAEMAARVAGIDATGLMSVRVGENVILLLPGAWAVARVAPSVALLGSVRRELRVATWLGGAGIPAVRPLVGEPFMVGELVVSSGSTCPRSRRPTW